MTHDHDKIDDLGTIIWSYPLEESRCGCTAPARSTWAPRDSPRAPHRRHELRRLSGGGQRHREVAARRVLDLVQRPPEESILASRTTPRATLRTALHGYSERA